MSKKRKITIKVGTNILTTPDGSLDLNSMRNLTYQIAQFADQTDFILISSGAITCGSEKLKVQVHSIPEKQAAASIGQILLLKEYQEFFSHKGKTIGQLLLTKDGINNPIRKLNILNTIASLHEKGVIPIINENDSVCTEEIEENFGDNDLLSSEIALIFKSDIHIILTDIDGLYSEPPGKSNNGTLIPLLHEITPELLKISDGPRSHTSRGGMYTKLKAAQTLLDRNITTIIANGRKENVLGKILSGSPVGTTITPG